MQDSLWRRPQVSSETGRRDPNEDDAPLFLFCFVSLFYVTSNEQAAMPSHPTIFMARFLQLVKLFYDNIRRIKKMTKTYEVKRKNKKE